VWFKWQAVLLHCQEATRFYSQEIARDIAEIRLICLVPLQDVNQVASSCSLSLLHHPLLLKNNNERAKTQTAVKPLSQMLRKTWGVIRRKLKTSGVSDKKFKLAVKENVTRSHSNLSYHLQALALPQVRFVLVRYHLNCLLFLRTLPILFYTQPY